MRGNLIGCFMVALSVLPCGAQQSRWENLDQIHAGLMVQVIEENLKSTTGQFVRFSESDLTLNVNDQEVVIPRDKVYRVSVGGKNRKGNALIGLGIGAAAGVGVGAAANRVVGNAGIIPACAAAWGGVGAGVVALMPASREIYRAESPASSTSAGSEHGTGGG